MALPIRYRRLRTAAQPPGTPDKASVEVARRIADDVARHFRVGDRLPSEPDMLRLYSVSRETLREGIRLLEVQGLVTIRRGPGGGPQVNAVNAAYLARSASLYFHMSGATYREVFEAWADLEPVLVARVTARSDRSILATAMAPYLDLTPTLDPRDGIEASATLHSEVARLSGNRVLTLLLQSIGHILTELMLEADDLARTGAELHHDHRALAAAIAGGHSRKAESLARDHIRHMLHELESIVGDRVDDVVGWR